jgi:protoporphyrinogen oxidase
VSPQIVISGAGISGLLCALVLSERGHGPQILVVDRNREPGGLLRRFNYGEWGDFDYGMHNVLETGIEELDRLVFGLLHESEWQVLEGARRDLAGLYVNGTLQKNTPYFDLRSLSPSDRTVCEALLLEHLSAKEHMAPFETARTAEAYLADRFGATVAAKTLVPCLEKIYGKPASDLDVMATMLTPMSRLAFSDDSRLQQLTESPFFRERIAWSDQRSLPLDRSSGRRALYPVRYGMYRVVEALVTRLTSAGVRIMTGAEVTRIDAPERRVQSLVVRACDVEHTVNDVARLIWTASIAALAGLLRRCSMPRQPDRPLRTIVANLVLDRAPAGMADLFYFFCYDPPFRTFRVTNFSNYCAGASRNGGYPVSLELLMSDAEMRGADLAQLAVEEFQRFGIADAATTILFAKAETLDAGFPMPSVANVEALREHRRSVRELALENVDMVGVLAEEDLFFQTDVLADAYRKLL